MKSINVDVLIVGGGGAGLSASCFLSDLGINSLLVERHPSTSNLPKAHYINQRSMEIYRQHGMADAVYARACPRDNFGKILWRTPFAGNGPCDQKIIYGVDSMGGGELTETYDLHGSAAPTHITQMQFEPILHDIAQKRNPGKVLFSHEMKAFSQSEDGVSAVIRNLESGEDIQVTAQYLLAADAGKSVGPNIGVNMIGPTPILSRVSVHFAADFSGQIPDDSAAMHCIINPNGSKAGQQLFTYLVAYGPEKWGRHSEEWGISLAFGPDEEVNLDEAHLIERISSFLQTDVPIKVLKVTQWFQQTMIADKFGENRIALIGDAAHKHPPGGGLGLNSGIQDAHNICWKLALMVKQQASTQLLQTYEVERRPVVERNAQQSMMVMESFMVLIASLGLMEVMPPEFNQGQILALLADTPDGAARRQRMNKVFEIAQSETGLHDLDIGFTYTSNAIIDDGTPPALRDPAATCYTPNTRPGSRLPHLFVQRDKQLVSSHDLIPMGGFLVVSGTEGDDWCSAAATIAAETGIAINAIRIGIDVIDANARWKTLCGITEGGVLLVRPDGHVAFRSPSHCDAATATLRSAIQQILHTH